MGQRATAPAHPNYVEKNYPDGSRYVGEFVDNARNGYGWYIWPNGETYEGDWLENRPHGWGKQRWHDEEHYEGEWNRGKKHGWGMFRWIDRSYEGEWRHDLKHGKGTMTYFKSNLTMTGSFIDGERHGLFLCTDSSGARWLQVYSNGELVSERDFMEDWSPDDVAKWIERTLNAPRLADLLHECNINGKILVEMAQREDFRTLGVLDETQLTSLLDQIQKLKEEEVRALRPLEPPPPRPDRPSNLVTAVSSREVTTKSKTGSSAVSIGIALGLGIGAVAVAAWFLGKQRFSFAK